MRSKSRELMNQIYSYVDQYYCKYHTVPSARQISREFGLGHATAHRYLVEMDKIGMLVYDGSTRTIVTKMIEKFSPATFAAPVVGEIPCGEPESEEENIEEYVSLPVSLFGKGEYYILRASGDSMLDAGIEEGDMIVVRKQNSAEVGDVVVALDENNSNTLKLFAGIDSQTNEAVLKYCNRKTYGEREIRVQRLMVQGIAKHVIKSISRQGI